MSTKIHVSSEEAVALNKENKQNDGDILCRIITHVGEMGLYQKVLFVFLMFFGVMFMFVYGTQMFVAATPQEHWCRVPELAHLDQDLRRNLSIPGAAQGRDWDRCLMFDANWTAVLADMIPPDPGSKTKPCSDGWEFLFNDIPYATVVSEREWVCEKSSYAPLAQSIFFLGSLIGCILFGWIGDLYGRVPALVGANLIGCLGGVLSTFTVGLWDFAICRFLVGMSNDCCFIMLYILVLEYIGTGHRTWVSNLSYAVAGVFGGILIPLLALWLLDWRKLLLVTSLPMLAAIAAIWVVPESARWLASTGRVDRAVGLLRRFEKINKRTIPEDVLQEFITTSSKKSETDESLIALFKNTLMRNCMVVLIIVSMVSALAIDALIRLSEDIGDNFFVTFGLSSLSEAPALIIVTLVLDRLGRRFMISGTLLLTVGLCVVCAFVPKGIPQMLLAVLSRFAVNMSVSVQVQIGAEILPTAVRATGTSLLHVMAFFATSFSPFVVYTGRFWRPLPLFILVALSLIGCGLGLLLPETVGRPMPQTIAEGEKLVRETLICRKPEVEEELEDMPYTKKFVDTMKIGFSSRYLTGVKIER